MNATLHSDTAATAAKALLPVLTDLLEAAEEIAASEAVLDRAPQIAGLCRDAAALADVLDVIKRRSAP